MDLAGSRLRTHGMKKLALPILLLVLIVPGAANGAACSPLNCSPSQFVLGHGTLLAVRGTPQKPLHVIDLRTGTTKWWLPAGIVTGSTLVHQATTGLTWYDVTRDARVASAKADGGTYRVVGTSQDAKRAVLVAAAGKKTTFEIVSPTSRRTATLPGHNWEFDALNGRNLILIQDLRNGYKVRLYNLATNTLQPQALKDPNESALIQGIPFERVSSPDGRYLFTLYIDGNGNAMIHELDTAAGHAYCIDLPGNGQFDAATTWAIVPSRDNSTVWAVSVGYGRVVGVDVAAHAVREHASFNRAIWTSNPGVAALAPDGKRLAVTDAQHTWFVDLQKLAVRRGPNHTAIALAFSPDGSRVWGVGQRSKIFSLRVNR